MSLGAAMPAGSTPRIAGLVGADARLLILAVIKPRPDDDPLEHKSWRTLVDEALDEKLRQDPAPPLSASGPHVEDGPQRSTGPCATTGTPPAAGTGTTG